VTDIITLSGICIETSRASSPVIPQKHDIALSSWDIFFICKLIARSYLYYFSEIRKHTLFIIETVRKQLHNIAKLKFEGI